MKRTTIHLLLITSVLSACATSSAIFRSGIEFTGDQARKDHYGLYRVDINKSYGISLIGNCVEMVHKGTMTFPFIPLPPVLPTGNKVKHEAAQRPFSLLLESSHGLAINHQQLKLAIELNGKKTQLHFHKEHISKQHKGKQYEYSTPYTCSDIKNASVSISGLRIAGTPTRVASHNMNFFEETKWTSN